MTLRDKAVVPLNTDDAYRVRAVKVYSGIVITCIGIQILFFFAITWYWSGGLRVVRWGEEDKRKEWAHESEETVMWTPQSLLLFWYYKEELEMQENVREGMAAKYQQDRRPTLLEENIRRSLSWIPGRRSQGNAT